VRYVSCMRAASALVAERSAIIVLDASGLAEGLVTNSGQSKKFRPHGRWVRHKPPTAKRELFHPKPQAKS